MARTAHYSTITTKGGLSTTVEFIKDDMDTEVRLPEISTLCWISWAEREAFVKELQALVDKYAI